MKYNIKEMVKDGKRVKFYKYIQGELYYITECGFIFTVPISDTGDGTFLAEDKAMFFMRYIRKQIQAIKDYNTGFESIIGPQSSLTDNEQGLDLLRSAGIINDKNDLEGMKL